MVNNKRTLSNLVKITKTFAESKTHSTEISDEEVGNSIFYKIQYKNYNMYLEDFFDELLVNIYKDGEFLYATSSNDIDGLITKIKPFLI